MAALLMQGSTGPAVRQLQKDLNAAGGSSLPRLAEDGMFGSKTRARVVEFQRSKRLMADGIAGPKTQSALKASGPPGPAGPPPPGGVTGISDVSQLVNAVVQATRASHSGSWKPQARFQGITIHAVSATGGPGCLVGPDLGGLILSRPQIVTLQGDDRLVATAAAKGIGASFGTWQAGVSVPGLPWYPAFASFPGPMAPPMPNVPSPLAALPSGGQAGLTDPTALQGAMSAHLDPGVKARDQAGDHKQVFGGIAAQVAVYFSGWLASQLVTGVMGTGPVPTFAPPAVPAGPVIGGSTLPGAGHLR